MLTFLKIFRSFLTVVFLMAGFFSFTEKAQAVDATGGSISWSGGYTIHTFYSGGTFTNNVNRNVEVLVVAGGGGGASSDYGTGRASGGGGAGGLVYHSAKAVAVQGYTVTIGGGGATDSVGGNSTFGDMTALGGGSGHRKNVSSTNNGGSGGGVDHGSQAYGIATQGNSGGGTGYGYNGSATGYDSGANGSPMAAGGGGGAGAAGSNGTSSGGGAGGAGLPYLSTYYAGGGGGGGQACSAGSGGIGGGGAGSSGSDGTAGAANTGGGGGGSGSPLNTGSRIGGAGGSGVVIVRYLTDNTAPYITSWGTYNAWTTGTTLTFTDAISMSGGGVRCQFGSWPTDSNPGDSSTSCAVGGNYNGASLYIRVWDWSGNQVTYASGETYGVYYYLDNTSPSTPGIMTTSWTGDHYVNTSFSAATSGATDTGGSGMRGYRLCRSNDNAGGCSVWTAAGEHAGTSETVSGSDLPSNGTFRYYYWYAYDNLGHQSANSTDQYVRMDSSGPSTPGIMTTSWAGDHYVKTSFSAATSGSSDGGSGMRGYRLCRSNDNAGGCSVWTAAGEHAGTSETVSGSDLPTNGTFRYYYWYAYDNLGNQSAISTGEYIRMDSTAPAFSSKTTYSGWYNANQTSTFTYTDSNSGIASGNNQTCTINTEGASQTCTLAGAVNVCDVAGNCINPNGQVSNGANIDKTAPPAPTLSCTVYTNNTWTNSSSATSCSINDTATPSPRTAVAYSTNNGSNWTDNANGLSFGFTPSEGTTNVIMRISDTGGGPTNSNTYVIKRDSSAPSAGTPTIYSGTNNGNQYFLGTISIQSAIADTGSGLNASSCQASINSGAWTGTGVTQNANYCYYNSYAPGANFTIQFRVADGTGTYGSSTTQSYILAYLPTVTTQAVFLITSTTAQGNGTIVDAGGENPTRYIEWGITSGIYTDSCDAGTGGAGVYNCPMTELSLGTPYYARAKATNLAGTAYGSEVSFQMDFVYPFRLKGWGIFNGHIRIK